MPVLKVSETDEFVGRLCAEVQQDCSDAADMGMLELALENQVREYQRVALQLLAQRRTDAVNVVCPECTGALRIESHNRQRKVSSRFGSITLIRTYGFCPDCETWQVPADRALGLHPKASASPRVQEICALTTLRHPAVHAQADTRRLTGLDIAPRCIHREARRQGERALKLRDADAAKTRTAKGVAELASRASCPQQDFTLVIEIDAWHIRERDHWGKTEALRKAGEKVTRWHWVYTATIFRLDQRATTAAGRPIIIERGYVATRQGLESFREQLYAEALIRGLTQAETVLVLGDGAAWIWNIAKDRFKNAVHRVDLYHVRQHLWAVAHELHGQGTEEARKWVQPYLQWLKRRNNGSLDVVNSLQDLLEKRVDLTSDQRENLEREIGYFNDHKDRMDYKQAKKNDQPLGSGAIESTCSQYQGRFKLRGQFWSLDGDEAFLALATLHRNERWSALFPHDCAPSP
jgi:hypothetical protein